MRIFSSLSDIRDIEDTAVALGTFDGVHLGHAKVIERCLEIAAERNLKSAIFTFSTASRLLRKGENESPAQNIITEEDKLRIFSEYGMDYVFDLPFTEDITALSPRAFAEDILLGKFKMKACICGFNYRFGHRASGDAALLSALGEELGFECLIEEAFLYDGAPVSSTRIRALLCEGRVSEAARLLGRPFSYSGRVAHGKGIGRSLGFPTCNLELKDDMAKLPNAVYISRSAVRGKSFRSMTNVGNKPTMGENRKNIETHIFDFSEDIYGEEIRIELLEKLRDEIKFPSEEELSEQLKRDKEAATAYFTGK